MPDVIDSSPTRDGLDETPSAIRESLDGLAFGSIAVTVHDGRVVQLDVTEKRRLAR